jgi:hypothetical protein
MLAIIGLCGVLAGSVLQSGAGGRSLTPRIASARALSEAAPAATSVAATQAAVVPVPSFQPALSAANVAPLPASPLAIAASGGVSAGTLAPTQTSGSSQAPATVAAASVSTTGTTQVSRAASPQSAPAAVPQFTANVARVAATPVRATSALASPEFLAAEAQVLGGATTPTGPSLGLDPTTSVPSVVESGSSGTPGSGAQVTSDLPFPTLQPYAGPLDTQQEAYRALGLPADFQFGGEPDPYVAGSYQSFVRDAAAGNKAAQAGLDLATSQGANFTAFH